MEHTVIHDEKVDRFEVFESGQIAYLQYDEKNGVLDILHTIVPPQLEGQGIAQALTEAAVRYASVVGLKIRPTCSFAKMDEGLKMLLLARKRIVHKAANKLKAFEDIIKKRYQEKGNLK